MAEAVFIVAAVLMLAGAIGVVASRNPVHAALFLVLTLFGVAILFVLQEAHFLAVVQVVVYAGAIVILFLFVIMLLGVDRVEKLGIEPIAGQRPLAALVGAALAAVLGIAIFAGGDRLTGFAQGSADRVLNDDLTDIERIGRVLFSEYAFAVEITAALLTIAVVGAVVLTRRQRPSGEQSAAFEGTPGEQSAAAAATVGEHLAAGEGTD